MATLFIVLLSMTSATSTATSLCDEVVSTLVEFRQYTTLSDDDVRAIAGRCYIDYVESQKELEEKKNANK